MHRVFGQRIFGGLSGYVHVCLYPSFDKDHYDPDTGSRGRRSGLGTFTVPVFFLLLLLVMLCFILVGVVWSQVY